MYDREIQGTEHKFMVSGMLWQHNLVMFDYETRTQWSQLHGKAMRGQFKGTPLKRFPSIITNLKTWREKFPQSSIMTMVPFTLAYDENYIDDRPSHFVVAMYLPDTLPKAWRYDQLKYVPVLNDTYGELPVLVTYNDLNTTAAIFNPVVGEETLQFEKHERGMLDVQTQSIWDPTTGVAIEGKLKGTQLELRDFINSFFLAWRRMNRDSNYWAAPAEIVKAYDEQHPLDASGSDGESNIPPVSPAPAMSAEPDSSVGENSPVNDNSLVNNSEF